jgi:tetratricopeptide (TPR) repeat protein
MVLALLAVGGREAAANDIPADVAMRVHGLIQQLGDEDYFVRQRAQEQLSQFGHEAFDLLTAAENDDDIEISTRVRYLLKLLRVEWTRPEDSASVRRLLKDYESLDPAHRATRIAELSQLPDQEGVPALCRLVRYESSQVLSKQAAAAVLQLPVGSPAEALRRDQEIARQLSHSPRTGAHWLMLLARLEADAQSQETWNQYVEQELATLEEAPEQTLPSLAITLLKRQTMLLQQADRTAEAEAAMRRIVSLEDGESDSLSLLVEWLADRQAWNILDEVGQRFAARLDQDPLLWYAVAGARQKQGRPDAVQEAVERARKATPADPESRFRLAYRLQQRGMIPFAVDEYRHVIELGPAGSLNTLGAQWVLAELLHDQGKQAEAAEVLLPCVAAMEENLKNGNQVQNGGREPRVVSARMKFFRATALGPDQNDQRIALLDDAITDEPFDADVLIALYRLPAPSPERRADTLAKIKQATEHFKKRIERSGGEEPMWYNQLAWLVSNTEGDLDHCLACSKKSLELQPNEAGYLDTLAHCYYARGEYAEAVKTQSMAAQLEPFSRQIAEKLTQFRRALEESQPKAESQPQPAPGA